MCEKAIAENVCYECKCTDMELRDDETGVICFYLNGDDIENHRRVIRFMMDNELIQKTKAGRLYNISFKFDDQTRACLLYTSRSLYCGRAGSGRPVPISVLTQAANTFGCDIYIQAVSYTHLDVYKRQSQTSVLHGERE